MIWLATATALTIATITFAQALYLTTSTNQHSRAALLVSSTALLIAGTAYIGAIT